MRRVRAVPAPAAFVAADAVRGIWEVIRPMGALRIEPHEDSGGWVAVFPFQCKPFASHGDLARAMFAALGDSARSTPFGSGRWATPDAWYVTFSQEMGG